MGLIIDGITIALIVTAAVKGVAYRGAYAALSVLAAALAWFAYQIVSVDSPVDPNDPTMVAGARVMADYGMSFVVWVLGRTWRSCRNHRVSTRTSG